MMPPEQRLKTRQSLRVDQLHLQFFQYDLFIGLRHANRFRHAPRLKKFQTRVQLKIRNPLSLPDFHSLMSQPWSAAHTRAVGRFNPSKVLLSVTLLASVVWMVRSPTS